MSIIFGCPPQGAIPDIPTECVPTIGQIIKIGFIKYKDSNNNINVISLDDINDEDSFVYFLDIPNDRSISMTPYIGEPTFEVGALKEYGGGNTTPFGAPMPQTLDPTKFTFNLINAHAIVENAMRMLGGTNLGCFLFTEDRKVYGGEKFYVEYDTYYLKPIKISKIAVMDKKIGGRESADLNVCEINFTSGWTNKFDFLQSSFDIYASQTTYNSIYGMSLPQDGAINITVDSGEAYLLLPDGTIASTTGSSLSTTYGGEGGRVILKIKKTVTALDLNSSGFTGNFVYNELIDTLYLNGCSLSSISAPKCRYIEAADNQLSVSSVEAVINDMITLVANGQNPANILFSFTGLFNPQYHELSATCKAQIAELEGAGGGAEIFYSDYVLNSLTQVAATGTINVSATSPSIIPCYIQRPDGQIIEGNAISNSYTGAAGICKLWIPRDATAIDMQNSIWGGSIDFSKFESAVSILINSQTLDFSSINFGNLQTNNLWISIDGAYSGASADLNLLGLTNLNELVFGYNGKTTYPSVAGLSKLTTVYGRGATSTSAAKDTLISQLVASGVPNNGIMSLHTSVNAPNTGAADYVTLFTTKGWTLTGI